ncbi:MAG: chlorite dismutase family protein, partial [Gammaproteobacteria bacterium]
MLIPIAKSEAWWSLPQDKRGEHFRTSPGYRGHTAIGADFAARIFRRLYHARGLPGYEWDFLTYFDFDEDDR